MSIQLPQAKLPSWNAPSVRSLPQIPTVGCVSGNATTQIGASMGSFPDIAALPQIKSLNKVITEQIGTLLEGKLPDAPRAALYQVRQARLVGELAQIVSTATQIAGQVQAEVSAAISGCNQKINDLNAAKDALLQIPEAARTAVQSKRIARYNDYANEVGAQIGRLEASLGCLA